MSTEQALLTHSLTATGTCKAALGKSAVWQAQRMLPNDGFPLLLPQKATYS